jgi:hypothetical protein
MFTVILENRLKWSRRVSDHWPQTSAEAKNEWNCTSFPHYIFVACARTALINFASSKVKLKPLDEWVSGYIIVHIFVLSEIYRVIILAQYSVAISSVDMSAACPGYGEIHGSGGGVQMSRLIQFFCGFFYGTPVMKSRSNFSHNYNYNYRGYIIQSRWRLTVLYAAGYACRS